MFCKMPYCKTCFTPAQKQLHAATFTSNRAAGYLQHQLLPQRLIHYLSSRMKEAPERQKSASSPVIFYFKISYVVTGLNKDIGRCSV